MRELLRRKLSVLLVLALAASAAGQATPTAAEEPSLESLRAHVRRLASDELTGRRTGTEGARKAAAYVEAEFRRLGLRPGWESGGAKGGAATAGLPSPYLQPFPYVAGVELGRRNAMSFHAEAGTAAASGAPGVDLRAGEDWAPVAWGANGRVERAGVTFVGYGITASELNHDDYAGADVRGRVALALAGTPDGDNPHGRFGRFADARFKAAAAREQGAAALVIVTREENFADDRLARLRVDENLSAAGDAGLPVVLVSRQVARRVVEAAALPSVTLEKLEQATAGRSAAAVSPAAGGEATQSGGAAQTGGTAGAPPPAAAAATQGGPQQQPAAKNVSLALPKVALGVETDVVRREAPAYNVVGVLEGSDAKLKGEAVVVGAHYDHLGTGGSGSLAPREGAVHHGADDNASGVAALLELARVFSVLRPRRTVVFVAFSGEEEGLIGSSYYVKNPAVPLAQTVAMINMDMVGRLREDRLIVGGAGTAAEWKELINGTNTELTSPRVNLSGMTDAERRPGDVVLSTGTNGQVMATAVPTGRFKLTLQEDGFGPSDHSSFYKVRVPVLFLFTGSHEDYHKPTDTHERVNYEGLARITAFARDLVRAVDERDRRPTYAVAKTTTPAGGTPGFRISLGTIPSYSEGGDGMKLDGVREGSPAEKAGLKAGDVIVRMAGRDIRNVYDYTYAMGEMKAGQEYEVEVVRGGERLKLKITPAGRR